ncbi:MAG: molybdopterin oxidoreductase family protein [Acidimicrobiales bacterium]
MKTPFLSSLIKAMGTRHIYSASTVDQMPMHVSSGLLFGDPDAIPVPDLDRTDFLLMIGANPYESNGSMCTAPDFPGRLERLLERGGTYVVVDPNRTKTAEKASWHLAPIPGTDAHLLLGLANVLFSEGLVDLGAVAGLLDGIDELQVAVRPFTPGVVASVTGLDESHITQLARDLAAAKTAAVYGRIGSQTNVFGTLASWAVDVINILTGNLDRPGGAMFSLPGHTATGKGTGRGFTLHRWTSRVSGTGEARAEMPAATMADEITIEGDGQLRALVVVAGNPVLSTPNSNKLDHALGQLDYMVSVDPWLNETSRRANIILPPPGPLSRSHYDVGLTRLAVRNVAKWSPALVPTTRPGEWEILARLTMVFQGLGGNGDLDTFTDNLIAQRVQRFAGVGGLSVEELLALTDGPNRTPADRLLDVMIRSSHWGDRFGENPDGINLASLEADPHGLDLGPMIPRLPNVLKTPDGRINILPAPIATDVDRLTDDLLTERPEGQFLLVGRRHLRSNNSWMHNVPVLVKGKNRCTLLVHPSDGDALGLVGGSTARVTSAVGTLDVAVELSDKIRPGVVSLPHGWGHDLPGTSLTTASANAGVNANVLTDHQALDPLSGNAQLNAIPVTVEAVITDPAPLELAAN